MADSDVEIGIRAKATDTGDIAKTKGEFEALGTSAADAAKKAASVDGEAEKIAKRPPPKIVDNSTLERTVTLLSEVEAKQEEIAKRPPPKIVDASLPGAGRASDDALAAFEQRRTTPRKIPSTWSRETESFDAFKREAEAREAAEASKPKPPKAGSGGKGGFSSVEATLLGQAVSKANPKLGAMVGMVGRAVASLSLLRVVALGVVGVVGGVLVGAVVGLVGWLAKGASQNAIFQQGLARTKSAAGGLGDQFNRLGKPLMDLLGTMAGGVLDWFAERLENGAKNLETLNKALGIPAAEKAADDLADVAAAADTMTVGIEASTAALEEMNRRLDESASKADKALAAFNRLSKAEEDLEVAQIDQLEASGEIDKPDADRQRQQVRAAAEMKRNEEAYRQEQVKKMTAEVAVPVAEQQLEADKGERDKMALRMRLARNGQNAASEPSEEDAKTISNLQEQMDAADESIEKQEAGIRKWKEQIAEATTAQKELAIQSKTLGVKASTDKIEFDNSDKERADKAEAERQKELEKAAEKIADEKERAAKAAEKAAAAAWRDANDSERAARAAEEEAQAKSFARGSTGQPGRIDGRSQRTIGMGGEGPNGEGIIEEGGVAKYGRDTSGRPLDPNMAANTGEPAGDPGAAAQAVGDGAGSGSQGDGAGSGGSSAALEAQVESLKSELAAVNTAASKLGTTAIAGIKTLAVTTAGEDKKLAAAIANAVSLIAANRR